MHTCHATACKINVAPELFMCRRHWFMLPSHMRNKIWRTYREGQCDDMNPSKEYCLIAKECVIFIANIDKVEADTKLYDFFLREAD